MATGTLGPLDVARRDFFCIRPSNYVLSRALSAGVAESITVPSGARYVLLSATADYYANYTTTATVAGDVTDGTASELNPTARFISGVTTISVISEGACSITASFFGD